MCEQKPLVSYLTPCKGVQVQSRILDFTPWIPIHCTRFQSLSVEPGFPAVNNIPDPLSCIPDFKAQVSGFHKKNFSKFRIPQAKNFPASGISCMGWVIRYWYCACASAISVITDSDLNFSYILNNTSWFQLATPYYNERWCFCLKWLAEVKRSYLT